MSAARTIEQECDSLQAEALKGGEYVAITNDLALRLVGTIRTLAVSAPLSPDNDDWPYEGRFISGDAERIVELQRSLHDLCDAFRQVYEAEYGPAPGENGVYHHARRLLGETP